MPQGDFVTFPSTVISVAISFVAGYLFFVGWWVPRVLLSFKVRSWLSQHPGNTAAISNSNILQPEKTLTIDVQQFLQSGSSFGFLLFWNGDLFSQVSFPNLLTLKTYKLPPKYEDFWNFREELLATTGVEWKHIDSSPTAAPTWSETFLLCLLFVALILVLISNAPDLSTKVSLQKLTPSLLVLPSLEWVYPVSTLLSAWFIRRNDLLSRLYVQVSSITASLVQNMASSLPVISMGQVHQRLKIAQAVLFSNSNVRPLE